MNLKEKITALCKERGITVRELERRANLKERTIQHWDESEPSGQKLYSVAKVLNVPIEELLSVYNPDMERIAYIEKLRAENEEAKELRETLRGSFAHRVLFDTAVGASDADLLEAAALIQRRKEERDSQ